MKYWNGVVCLFLMVVILACGGSSDYQEVVPLSSVGVKAKDVDNDVRIVTGTLVDVTFEMEAPYNLAVINHFKVIDESGNVYITPISKGTFSIRLPADKYYVAAFLQGNHFIARMYYGDMNWFKVRKAPGQQLHLGQIELNRNTQIAETENDPWEGEIPIITSPFADKDIDGISAIFENLDKTNKLTFGPLPLLTGVVGVAYDSALAAAGGKPPYAWSISAGNLPAGLSLDSITGHILGIPTTYEIAAFTLQITDTRSISIFQDFTLTISGAAITTITLPNATTDSIYIALLEAVGDPTDFVWSISTGGLPTGLSLNVDTGEISGTATVSGNYVFIVTATNGIYTDSREFSLEVIGNFWTQVTPVGGSPIARCKHNAVTINDKMYLFGTLGVNDLWEYDFVNNIWEELILVGSLTARNYYSTSVINNAVYVFGGNDGGFRNDLWKYMPVTNTWSQMSPVGSVPTVRETHSAVVVNDKLYVFGGWKGTTNKNDLWEYDPTSNEWTELFPISSLPTARRSHAAVAIDNKMYMFGGYNGAYKNDLWEYDPSRNTWTQLAPVGSLPAERWGHCLAVMDNKLYAFGGVASGIGIANDLWEYNFITNSWVQLLPTGALPAARRSCSIVVINDRLYIFGGIGTVALDDLWKYVP